jgi:eukaryotic-like serine/threonine-protein kinase
MSDQGTTPATDGLGNYRLGRRLDGGGTNEVYEAQRPGTPGKIVVKLLHGAAAAGPETAEACWNDQTRVTRLRHPSIATLLAFGATPAGVPCLVREHVEGESLEAQLTRCGHMEPDEVATLVEDMATALAAAHASGVVHGELRPGKVLLAGNPGDPGRIVKLIDFALWRLTGDRRAAGDRAEAVRYTAPELIDGAAEVSGQADQFSLAAIVYRMLSGVDAFPGDEAAGVAESILERPPALAGIASHDPTIDTVLRRALARNPRERFPGILEFAGALEVALTSPGGPNAYEETTDMLRRKTASDIANSLSQGPAHPSYANLVEVVRPARPQKPLPEPATAAADLPSAETGQPTSVANRDPSGPRRGRPRSRREERLALAAALLSAAAGIAWWTGLMTVPAWQALSELQSVLLLTPR